ncbi:MAG: hypothetical protein JXX14_03650 [Deltaproteobacteria bacterium]|nr:hypothetical protein [Deltaproteobacteria bacterium]
MKYAAILILLAILSLLTVGCDKEIGDSCSRDMDCSPNGDRSCDRSQPGGYCLIISCEPDGCPGEAACAEFVTPSPDFGADTDSDSDTSGSEAFYEQLEASRARTYCLKKCRKDRDCRGAYQCALDTLLEDDLNGLVIDSKFEGIGVCVPKDGR